MSNVKTASKNSKLSIIFFGSDPWSVIVLKNLEKHFKIAAVVTAPNSAVFNYFKGLILTPEKLDNEFNTRLLTLDSRLFVVASYGKIIPQTTLDIPKYGALNVHPSLLPIYRGPSPIPATILNGDKETGVTIMKMDAEMDHGPIIFTKKIKLSQKETFNQLITKLFQLGTETLVEVIPNFVAGEVSLKEQNHKKATYCQRLTKEDGYFDINHPPSKEKLDRMIRAYNPWPGVWTKWNGKIVKFFPPTVIPEKSGIHTNKFCLQIEGKKILSVKDFLNGYPDFPKQIVAALDHI